MVAQLLLTACSVSKPPNSAAAAAVLAEMRRCDAPLTATHFNRVINCCKIAKTWRRALVVFKVWGPLCVFTVFLGLCGSLCLAVFLS